MRTWIASLLRRIASRIDPVRDDSFTAAMVDLERPSRGGL